jgi:hypothetical protein
MALDSRERAHPTSGWFGAVFFWDFIATLLLFIRSSKFHAWPFEFTTVLSALWKHALLSSCAGVRYLSSGVSIVRSMRCKCKAAELRLFEEVNLVQMEWLGRFV